MVWYMYQFLKPKSRGESLYELKDLLEVALGAHSVKCSISELENFLLRWDIVLTTMKRRKSVTLEFTEIDEKLRKR